MKSNKNQPNLNSDVIESIDDIDANIDSPPPNQTVPDISINPKPKKSRKKLLIVIIAVVVIIAIAACVWYFVIYKNGQSNNNTVKIADITSTTKKDEVKLNAETDPQVIKFITPTTGEVWLDKPIAIEKQGFFLPQEFDGGESDINYFNVGNKGDNTIIMTAIPGMGIYYMLFEKSPDGKITLINHSDGLAVYNSDYDNNLSTTLDPKVQISNDIHYDSLSIPNQIKLDDKGSVALAPKYPSLGFEYIEPQSNNLVGNKQTEIKKFGKSTLYKNESTNVETGLVSISYSIKTPLNTRITMEYEPLDLSLSGYKWSTGYSPESDSLHAISRGCGLSNASVTRSDSITDSDVVSVGKSGKGLVIYEFKDSNNALLQKAFTEFKDFYKDDPNFAYKNMTIDEFVKLHALVIYKDLNNQWLVYVSDQLSPAGGCAKPVVYLYPEKQQSVTVKVGADVKISDPYYNPATGWTAIAQPDGQLTVGGVNFSSLFWEGPGYGQYPEITEGIIVKQQDVISTIRKQLALQGLNNNEINDFVDYWQDNLPTDPYVRLTWFNTSQMEQLAPLSITPKPDTVIRVFLDASGMKKPINIPKQNLKSIPRVGFTVIEWGGLSSRKLY